ncbi:MAG: hypothetical protein HZB16_25095 [Armatimonadetes bacterium]|nr:hypothetical protein [Armatimonadota bacterium]
MVRLIVSGRDMARRCLTAWLIVGLLASAGQAATPSPPASPETAAGPGVQVVVFFDPNMGYSASAAYSGPVSEGQARSDLEALAKAVGYEGLGDLRPFNLDGSQANLTYSVVDRVPQIGFRMSERALLRDKGTFRLEAFIDAFRRYRRIDLNFDVGDLAGTRFNYRGLGDYEDKNVRIRHRGTGRSHEFNVEILNDAYTRLDLPPYALPVAPLEGTSAKRPAPGAGTWIAVVVGALGCGAITFVLLSLLLGRRAARRRPGRAASARDSV